MREHAKARAEFRKHMLLVHATQDEMKAILARLEVILQRHETILARQKQSSNASVSRGPNGTT